MIKISEAINTFKNNLILKQLDNSNQVPIVAFNSFEEIEEFCKQFGKQLIWQSDALVID